MRFWDKYRWKKLFSGTIVTTSDFTIQDSSMQKRGALTDLWNYARLRVKFQKYLDMQAGLLHYAELIPSQTLQMFCAQAAMQPVAARPLPDLKTVFGAKSKMHKVVILACYTESRRTGCYEPRSFCAAWT